MNQKHNLTYFLGRTHSSFFVVYGKCSEKRHMLGFLTTQIQIKNEVKYALCGKLSVVSNQRLVKGHLDLLKKRRKARKSVCDFSRNVVVKYQDSGEDDT